MKILSLSKALIATAIFCGGILTSQQSSAKLQFTGKDDIFKHDKTRTQSSAKDTTITLWKGERSGMASVFTAPNHTGRLKVRLESASKTKIPESFSSFFIDDVLTNDYRKCGHPADTLPPFEVGDVVVSSKSHEISKNCSRNIWTIIDVPANTNPGDYDMNLIVSDIFSGKDYDTLKITVKVIDRQLPSPQDQKFFVNFWQQPYAISRYYDVKPWSDEHLKKLTPVTQLLARAGQKAISTILFYEPWGVQSNDKFDPMIETTLGVDGKWHYDYTVFDKYVNFMDKNGINGPIECFSMIPWDMSFRYYDAKDQEYKFLKCKTSDESYSKLWTPFLKSFEKHLKEKGWLDRTYMAIDERGLQDMQNAMSIAKKAAPGLKFSLAGNYHKEIADNIDILTLVLHDPFPAGELEKRHAKGQTSLYYTCCSSPEPNIFSNNDPIDAAYIPVFCTANGTDGYLHWAFSNWTDNPLHDTRFYMFAPGDTYCIYPGGTSLRWERFIEGIHTSEKARLLREEFLKKGQTEKVRMIDEALKQFVGNKPPKADQRLKDYDNLLKVINSLQ